MTDSVKTFGGIAVAAIKTFSGVASAGVKSLGGIAVSGGGGGTFATFEPTGKSAHVALTGGNLIATSDAAAHATVLSTLFASAGKLYCEFTATSNASGDYVGIATAAQSVNSLLPNAAASYSYDAAAGHKWHSSESAYGATWTNGDVISVLLDFTAGTLIFWKNGASQGTAFTGISGSFCPAVSMASGAARAITANFGASAFTYTPPAGYAGWSA